MAEVHTRLHERGTREIGVQWKQHEILRDYQRCTIEGCAFDDKNSIPDSIYGGINI
jgi:hypothetical protein